MATEIERKFLVLNDSWRTQAAPGVVYRQGYLSESSQCSIRVRTGGGKGYLNLKSATLGVTRTEFDYVIPEAEANEILSLFCWGSVIEKTRYKANIGNHVWEIDVFEGDNKGLVVAEIELQDEHESFERPSWVGKEVSDDPRYYNVCLVTHPYKDWKDQR